jgi:hypothetical protein
MEAAETSVNLCWEMHRHMEEGKKCKQFAYPHAARSAEPSLNRSVRAPVKRGDVHTAVCDV